MYREMCIRVRVLVWRWERATKGAAVVLGLAVANEIKRELEFWGPGMMEVEACNEEGGGWT